MGRQEPHQSQPLFLLPLSGDSSSQPPPPTDHATELDSEPDACWLGSRTIRYRFGFSSSYLANKSHNHYHHHQQQQTSERAGNNETNDNDDSGKRKRQDDAKEVKSEAKEATVQKPRNLRPRKAAFPRGVAEIGAGGSGNGELSATTIGGPSEPKSLRLREMVEMQQQGVEARVLCCLHLPFEGKRVRVLRWLPAQERILSSATASRPSPETEPCQSLLPLLYARHWPKCHEVRQQEQLILGLFICR